MARILVVDDEIGIRAFVADTLAEAGHDVGVAANADEALRRLEDAPFDLLLVDLRMPGERTGMDVVRRARAEWPAMQIVVLTAHGTVETAVEAMRLGAFDFLQKPIAGPVELRRIAVRALNWRGSGASRREVAPASGDDVHGQAVTRPDVPPARAGTRGVLGDVLWQLKRRRVYNVAATYAAIGFLTLQGAELILPALPVPVWTYRAIVGMVILGFPIAAMLGWIYDITSQGVQRTPRAWNEGESG